MSGYWGYKTPRIPEYGICKIRLDHINLAGNKDYLTVLNNPLGSIP